VIVIFLGTAIFIGLEETVGLGVIVFVGAGDSEIRAGLEGIGVGDAVTWVEGNGVGGTGVGDGDGDATAGKEGLGALHTLIVGVGAMQSNGGALRE